MRWSRQSAQAHSPRLRSRVASSIGDDGVGDPYYPKMGNTGYDVQSYDVDLASRGPARSRRRPRSRRSPTRTAADPGAGPGPWPASTSTSAGPRSPRSRSTATEQPDFAREGQELIDRSDAGADSRRGGLRDGDPLQGPPEAGLESRRVKDGWTKTGDGAVALGEPQQTPSWIPGQRPSDRQGDVGISLRNAARLDRDLERRARSTRSARIDQTITEWEQNEPMASYLALAAIGKFRFDEGEVDGHPVRGRGRPAHTQVRRGRDP